MKRAALALALAVLALAPAAEARGRRCREDAPVQVLGRRRCGRFGRWDATPLVAAISPSVTAELDWHRLLIAPRTLNATLTVNGKLTGFDVAGSKVGLARTDIAAGRASFEYGYVGPVRIGWVGEFGGNNVTGQAFAVRPQTFTVQGVSYGSLGLNLAATAGTVGRFLFRGELFSGVQFFHLGTLSSVPIPAATASTPQGFDNVHFRLAPRASVEVWTNDHLTLGVAGEMDVIYRDDFMVGGFLRGYLDRRGVHDPRL